MSRPAVWWSVGLGLLLGLAACAPRRQLLYAGDLALGPAPQRVVSREPFQTMAREERWLCAEIANWQGETPDLTLVLHRTTGGADTLAAGIRPSGNRTPTGHVRVQGFDGRGVCYVHHGPLAAGVFTALELSVVQPVRLRRLVWWSARPTGWAM